MTIKNISNVTTPFLSAEVTNGNQLRIKAWSAKATTCMVTDGHHVVV